MDGKAGGLPSIWTSIIVQRPIQRAWSIGSALLLSYPHTLVKQDRSQTPIVPRSQFSFDGHPCAAAHKRGRLQGKLDVDSVARAATPEKFYRNSIVSMNRYRRVRTLSRLSSSVEKGLMPESDPIC